MILNISKMNRPLEPFRDTWRAGAFSCMTGASR